MTVGIALVSVLLLQPVVGIAQQPTPGAAATEPSEKPLPDVKALLNDVQRNEVLGEKVRNDYTYHVHLEQDDFDNKGNVKKTEVTESESIAIDGIRVDRIVAKDGKPLTDDEKKKEDEKINKEVEHGKRRRAQLAEKDQPSADRGEALMPASRFFELGTFSNARRVMLDGRPTIVLDYAGDPKAKTKNEFEGVVKDLVGTVWVDEEDRTLVKLEGHFLKDFKVGAGLLADIHGGTDFNARFQKVNGEVWLPAEINGTGFGRFLLFVKFSGRLKLVVSDYRKYRTGATIVPSYREIGPDGKIVPDAQTTPSGQTPSTSGTPPPQKP